MPMLWHYRSMLPWGHRVMCSTNLHFPLPLETRPDIYHCFHWRLLSAMSDSHQNIIWSWWWLTNYCPSFDNYALRISFQCSAVTALITRSNLRLSFHMRCAICFANSVPTLDDIFPQMRAAARMVYSRLISVVDCRTWMNFE